MTVEDVKTWTLGRPQLPWVPEQFSTRKNVFQGFWGPHDFTIKQNNTWLWLAKDGSRIYSTAMQSFFWNPYQLFMSFTHSDKWSIGRTKHQAGLWKMMVNTVLYFVFHIHIETKKKKNTSGLEKMNQTITVLRSVLCDWLLLCWVDVELCSMLNLYLGLMSPRIVNE